MCLYACCFLVYVIWSGKSISRLCVYQDLLEYRPIVIKFGGIGLVQLNVEFSGVKYEEMVGREIVEDACVDSIRPVVDDGNV